MTDALVNTTGWQPVGDNEHLLKGLLIRHGISRFGTEDRAPNRFREVDESHVTRSHLHYNRMIVAIKQVKLGHYITGMPLPQPIQVTLLLNDFGYGYGFSFSQERKALRWFVFEMCPHQWQDHHPDGEECVNCHLVRMKIKD